VDALDLLIADHNRVRGLFRKFEAASDADDTDALIEVTGKIRTELEVHTTIEEDRFYPAVRDLTDETRETVAEGIEEHHAVDLLLAELAELTADDEAWKAKWTVVIENVEHHAEEEEQELFPKVRGATDADWRAELGEDLDRRKGELGAPTLHDRVDLTLEQVRTLATEQEIPGRSTMSADELRATVNPA
jgi:hemerythrin superfamily protein